MDDEFSSDHPQDELPEALECPVRWPYDLNWEKKNIPDLLGWNRVEESCAVMGSGEQIRKYLTYSGQRALEKVVTQNAVLSRIRKNPDEMKDVSRSHIDWQGGNTWARMLETTEVVFNAYRADDAPEDVLICLDFTRDFIQRGSEHAAQMIAFVEKKNAEREATQRRIHQQRMDDRERKRHDHYEQQHASAAKWRQIGADHSAVEAGFIYVLKNDLMPGVFKVGFTASNPDRRADEISHRYGLPMPFVLVEYWRTKDPYIVEQRIHQSLAAFKSAGEFFKVDLEALKQAVVGHLQQEPKQ